MEILRRSAGGNGFSSYSGLPGLQTEIAPTATFEGDNTVLLLQTARFLVKEFELLEKGKIGEVSGLVKGFGQMVGRKEFGVELKSGKCLDCPENLCAIFRNNAYQTIVAAVKKLK
jgi:acyl-CoA oxidase